MRSDHFITVTKVPNQGTLTTLVTSVCCLPVKEQIR